MARLANPGIDTRRLRYFLAVCDNGGILKAAAAIGLAQPTLTRQIHLLEEEIGVDLFTRNGRGSLPTEAGAELRDAARNHLQSLDGLVARLRRDYRDPQPRLALGVCPTIAPLFLETLSAAIGELPGPPGLTVIEAYSGDLRSLLQAGQLDLALSYSATDMDGSRITPLLRERLVVTGAVGTEPGPMTLAALSRLKLILPSRSHQLRRIIDAACAARGLTLTPALELDSLAAVKAMLSANSDHATVLPLTAVTREAAEGVLAVRVFEDPLMVREVALIQPSGAGPALPAPVLAALAARATRLGQELEAAV